MKLYHAASKTPEQANFDHLVWDIAWFGIAFTATSRFMSVFAIRAGADAIHLGLISSLPAIGMLIASYLAVRWRRRYENSVEAVFWPSFFFRFVFLLPAFTPFFPEKWQPLWLILSVVLPALPQGIASVIFIALMRESVETKRVTDLVSRRFVALNIAVALGALTFGIWLEKVPYPVNYQIMFLVAFAATMVSLWEVTQIQPLSTTPRGLALDEEIQINPWRDPNFQKVAIIVMVSFIAFFSVFPMVPLRLVDDLDATEGFMAIFSVLELAAAATMANFAPKLVRAVGARKMIGVAMIGTGIGSVIVATAPSLEVALLGAVFLGGSWTSVDISSFSFFNENAPQKGNARFSQAYYQVSAIALFVGPMIGSQLANAGMTLTAVLIFGALLRMSAGVFSLTASPMRRMMTQRQPSQHRVVGKG